MAVVMFLLDALRYDYLTEDDMPFLSECATSGEYYERVIPSFGYCERAEILTGLSAIESGFFTALAYDPERSPYRKLDESVLLLAEILEPLVPKRLHVPGRRTPGGFYRYYRSLVARLIRSRTGGVSPYCIPSKTLRSWALTEDRIDHREQAAFPVPSILSLTVDAGLTFYYDSFTSLTLAPNGSDRDRLQLALGEAGAGHELYLVYQAAPDAMGHRFGPWSPELKTAIRRLDKDLSRFVRDFEKARPGSRFVFLGDHGMLEVSTQFNALEVLRKLARACRARLNKDYLYFLDSTLVRIWSFSARGDELINAVRQNGQFANLGAFAEGEVGLALGVPCGDRRYGDVIWCAHPGVLVFPDFFHRDHPAAGMHGYNPQIKESQGLCIVYGANVSPKRVPSLPLARVFDILKTNVLSE